MAGGLRRITGGNFEHASLIGTPLPMMIMIMMTTTRMMMLRMMMVMMMKMMMAMITMMMLNMYAATSHYVAFGGQASLRRAAWETAKPKLWD